MTQAAEATLTLPVDEAFEPTRRARLGTVATISLAWVALAVVACTVVPVLLHANPDQTNPAQAYAGPSGAHPLGADALGRDELARLLVGGRITLAVGAVAAFVAMSIGTLYGSICGYYGGWLDTVLMRVVDVLLSVPTLFLLLFLAALFHGNVLTLMLVIGATSWLGPARLVRGEILTLKERLYIEAARASGAGNARIIFRPSCPTPPARSSRRPPS